MALPPLIPYGPSRVHRLERLSGDKLAVPPQNIAVGVGFFGEHLPVTAGGERSGSFHRSKPNTGIAYNSSRA